MKTNCKEEKFTKYSGIDSWICFKCGSVMPKDTEICWVCGKKRTGKEKICKMTLEKLRKKCLKIKGIEKVRTARKKDGVFLYYKELFTGTRFWKPTDFIHLDSWKDSLERTKAEYERFYK